MEKTGRTREKNKDAMVLFLYKSHLYKDGCLYCQIYRTYLQVTLYGNCPHFANTVLPRTKQQTTACIVNSQEKWTTAILKNNYNHSSNSHINNNNNNTG